MERQSVSSSAIISVGWEVISPDDPTTGNMEVEFKDGRVYTYSGVPKTVYEDFTSASSLGHYFNASIRNNYPYSH